MEARAAYAGNRRRAMIIPWWKTIWARVGVLGVGLLLVIVLFIVIAARGSGGINRTPAPPDVLRGVSSVTAATFASVGTGEVTNPLHVITPGVPIARDASGKPIVLYVGGEFCPYCAAERWSMVVTLYRFGTFSNLRIISSSPTDQFANTPTFTFYKSTYSSPYLDFQPVELYDRNSAPLETMTSEQSKMFATYNPAGSYPFMDFGNQYYLIGASYKNEVLTGEDWHSIAGALNNPNSNVTQSIVGTANYMTAAICQINGNKPASVCSAAPIPAIEKTIGKPAGS